MSPPDGWRTAIRHPIFQHWGWHSIAITPADYQWGTVHLDTDRGSFEFSIGPEDPNAPQTPDALWYAYTWLLAWIEGVSSPALTFKPPSTRPRADVLSHGHHALRLSALRRLHRTFGSHSRPVQTQKPKHRSPVVTPHPVCGYRRRHPTNPEYIAPKHLQLAAAKELISLPPGYTFIPAHWNPKHLNASPDADPRWITVAWAPETAMQQWQTITAEIATQIPVPAE